MFRIFKKSFVILLNAILYILQLENNLTGETLSTTEEEFQTKPVMTMEAVRNTLGMYFNILDELKWGDTILVLGFIML